MGKDKFVFECKQCGKEMNPIDAVLSSTHGVCGDCTRRNHRLVINGREIERKHVR